METGLASSIKNRNSSAFYEYLLVAHPGTDVNEKVLAEKQSFYEQYGQRMAVKTKPHITIANFLAKEMMEETILRFMRRIFSRQLSFETALNNYSGFPPHTIYLRVQNQQPFKQLTQELKIISNYIHSCSCPPVRLITNPHLTIARQLSEGVYQKAIMDYAHKTFHEKFVVDELILLRRTNQYDTCKVVNVFTLQPQARTLFN